MGDKRIERLNMYQKWEIMIQTAMPSLIYDYETI